MYVEFIPKRDLSANHKFGKMNLKEGKHYIFHESWIGEIPGNVILLEDKFRNYTIDIPANGKSILFMRTMGGGDILFLSSLIHYIKSKYPDVKIGFACIEEQTGLALLMDGVQTTHPMPLDAEIFHNYDYHFEVSGLLEGNPANLFRNVYDIYFEKLGIEVVDGIAQIDNDLKRPFLQDTIIHNLKELNVSKESKIIGLHPFAHDPLRQLDTSLVNEYCKILLEKGYTILIFSSKEEMEVYQPFIDNRVLWVGGLSYLSSIKALSSCDILIGCDSLLIHAAQAIDIKTIALYGPFDPKTRIGYYKNITIVDSNPDCRCSLHGVGQCPKEYRTSPCLNFDPELILFAVENVDSKETQLWSDMCKR